MTDVEHRIAVQFLSSSWFAEVDATPVVRRLLEHPCDPEERAALIAYAREEDLHGALIADLFRRRGMSMGPPFWIQRVFHLVRSRASLLLQFFHVELLAGTFYGAMAGRVRDPEMRALIRRLLRDEARHIRLHRELLRREIARLGFWGRLRARALALVLRVGMAVTGRVQARQLAPVLGPTGLAVPRKIDARLREDLRRIFAGTATPQPLPALAGASGPSASQLADDVRKPATINERLLRPASDRAQAAAPDEAA